MIWIFGVFFIALSFAVKTPENIKPYRCRMDKDMNRCVMKNANQVIPLLAHGVPELQIPPLDPFELEFLQVIDTPSLHLNLTKINIYGLSNFRMIAEPIVELKKGIIENTFQAENLTMKGFYSADGHVSIIPIRGSGPFTMYFKNGVFKVHIRFTLIDENALQYIRRQKLDMESQCDLIVFNFAKISEENPKIGEEVNKFLNENWRQVLAEFGPGINTKLLSIVGEYLIRPLQFLFKKFF